MRLTERACRDLARTADVAGRPFRRDDGVPGFGLRRRSLAAKVWPNFRHQRRMLS